MFSFFKNKTDETSVPAWASFFSNKEYSLFMKEIDNFFKSISIQYEIENGQILVKENEFGFSQLGLMNVAQVCNQAELKDYRRIITSHFNSLLRSNQFKKEFEKIKDNFEKIKEYIGVRLYDNEYVAHVGKENTIGKDFAGDIYAMIVFDFPDSIVNIKPEEITAWSKSIDELFEIGIQNIREKYPLTITKETFEEFSLWFVQAEHFFVPNIVFDIESQKKLIGAWGSLVGLPHRHAALIYPIENLEVVTAINTLILTINGMSQEGPGSLSNNLFWYKDGVFKQLPFSIEGKSLNFFPPEDFVEVLNELK